MNGTFLIVEDQENDAFFLIHALKKAGLHNPVQVVEDGQKALDYLSGSGQYENRVAFPIPSVIFLDLKLPQVNGLDVLHWLRTQTSLPPIIVVVLTSSSLEEDIVQAYRLGANSYVVKPSNIEKLVDTVKDFANWWLKHDQLQSGPELPGARPKMAKLAVSGMVD